MADLTRTDEGLRELALFAGAGGGILGGTLLGWRTVCAVEYDAYAASVLCARQNDGLLPPFPIWDDVRTFDGRPWAKRVDVVAGGFPCQDISAAGKGAGITGKRSGLWVEMARIIGEVRPRYAFVENSPILTVRGLGVVLGDLAAMGYDARWGVLGAADVGAPHLRERIWIRAELADAGGDVMEGRNGRQRVWNEPERCGDDVADAAMPDDQASGCQRSARAWNESGGSCSCGNVCHADGTRLEERKGQPSNDGQKLAAAFRTDWWATEPDVGRVADGVAARVDRLKAIGNGQVPQCAAEAWRLLGGE